MLHMLPIYFVGNIVSTWSAKDDCLGPRHLVLELLLEDLMREARNQVTLLHGVPPSNRRPNGGDQPHTLRSTSSTHQEEHQGVGGVSTYRRVRLQPSKTFDYRQVPLRGRLWLQSFVTIGHSPSTAPRAHQFGCKCVCDTSQDGA